MGMQTLPSAQSQIHPLGWLQPKIAPLQRPPLLISCSFRYTYMYKPCLLIWLYTIDPPSQSALYNKRAESLGTWPTRSQVFYKYVCVSHLPSFLLYLSQVYPNHTGWGWWRLQRCADHEGLCYFSMRMVSINLVSNWSSFFYMYLLVFPLATLRPQCKALLLAVPLTSQLHKPWATINF